MSDEWYRVRVQNQNAPWWDVAMECAWRDVSIAEPLRYVLSRRVHPAHVPPEWLQRVAKLRGWTAGPLAVEGPMRRFLVGPQDGIGHGVYMARDADEARRRFASDAGADAGDHDRTVAVPLKFRRLWRGGTGWCRLETAWHDFAEIDVITMQRRLEHVPYASAVVATRFSGKGDRPEDAMAWATAEGGVDGATGGRADCRAQPPHVGDPCTVCIGSDRYPYYVRHVQRNGRLLGVAPAIMAKPPALGWLDAGPEAECIWFTLRHDGRYRERGKRATLVLYELEHYTDPCF